MLQTLTSIGLSGEAIRHMTKDQLEALTGDPTKEVPRVKAYVRSDGEELADDLPAPEREVVYHTIERDQWVRIESAKNAARKVEKALKREYGENNFARVMVSSRVNGHHREKAIKVTYDPKNELGEGRNRKRAKVPDFEKFQEPLPTSVDGAVESEELNSKPTMEDIPVQYEQETVEPDHTCEERSTRDHYDEHSSLAKEMAAYNRS